MGNAAAHVISDCLSVITPELSMSLHLMAPVHHGGDVRHSRQVDPNQLTPNNIELYPYNCLYRTAAAQTHTPAASSVASYVCIPQPAGATSLQ
jgi:hypothetical protein